MTAHDRRYAAMQGQTLSGAWFGVGPGAEFFAGPVDLPTGKPKDAWSWTSDTSGNLVFKAHYAANAGVEAVKLELNGQRIGMKCRTGFYGYLQHFNTAERNWTFPDISGQVVVHSGAVVNGGGSTATLGTIGGSGPTVAAQWGWGITWHNGTAFYQPLWR